MILKDSTMLIQMSDSFLCSGLNYKCVCSITTHLSEDNIFVYVYKNVQKCKKMHDCVYTMYIHYRVCTIFKSTNKFSWIFTTFIYIFMHFYTLQHISVYFCTFLYSFVHCCTYTFVYISIHFWTLYMNAFN